LIWPFEIIIHWGKSSISSNKWFSDSYFNNAVLNPLQGKGVQNRAKKPIYTGDQLC